MKTSCAIDRIDIALLCFLAVLNHMSIISSIVVSINALYMMQYNTHVSEGSKLSTLNFEFL